MKAGKKTPSDPERYLDGVGLERCLFCQSALRTPDDKPVALVLVEDLEEIICVLEQIVDCPEVWGNTIKRLEQACGRTFAQICAADRLKREAAAT